jgi:spore protease
MGIRTDLAIESAQTITLKQTKPFPGIVQEEYDEAECHVTHITVEDGRAADAIGKPIGKYVTIETQNASGLDAYPEYFDEQVELIAKEISELANNDGDVLVIGLGNDDITPDALGPLVAKQIFATRHIPKEMPGFDEFSDIRSVAVLAPGVLGQTGIEVAEITKAICEKIKPGVVIVIDALACSEISRLGNTIQITNTGISPGSGVKNSRKELSKATLNAPVIALGVPTVVDMQTIAEQITGQECQDKKFRDVMVTPRCIDKLIERSAKLIAMAINRAFQPSMSIEDISSLI